MRLNPWVAALVFWSFGTFIGSGIVYVAGGSNAPSFLFAGLGIIASVIYARWRGFSVPRCAAVVLAAAAMTLVLSIIALFFWLTLLGIAGAISD